MLKIRTKIIMYLFSNRQTYTIYRITYMPALRPLIHEFKFIEKF